MMKQYDVINTEIGEQELAHVAGGFDDTSSYHSTNEDFGHSPSSIITHIIKNRLVYERAASNVIIAGIGGLLVGENIHH